MLIRVLVYLCMVFFSGMAGAEVYKCVVPGKNIKTIYSESPCGADAKVVSGLPREKTAPSANLKQAPQTQSISLALNSSLNYTVPGSVNGVPVVYLVDTGASMTSVSKRVAEQAGVVSCLRTIDVLTSNGKVRECVAIVPEITFGFIKMRNIEVAIAPEMSIDALLGMSTLRSLKVIHQDGKMTISN